METFLFAKGVIDSAFMVKFDLECNTLFQMSSLTTGLFPLLVEALNTVICAVESDSPKCGFSKLSSIQESIWVYSISI